MSAFATLTERVYIALRRDILEGRLQPGARLVRRELAKNLSVSTVPVAEALLRLESDGLVVSAPMHGARVVGVDESTVTDDLVLREAVECQAARECASGASAALLSDLAAHAAHIDALMLAGNDLDDRVGDERHGEFHLAIAAACRPVLARELQRLWFRRQMRRAWATAKYHGLPPDWHQGLVNAIARRDPDCAERHMRFHVRWNTVRHQERP